MYGPEIVARTLSVVRPFGKRGYVGQYHSQSDHHSKVACWSILFDLLLDCALLRDHIAAGEVVFGLNHKMSDWKQHREKALDLVLARPRGPERGVPFYEQGLLYGVHLSAHEQALLESLPTAVEGDVGSVLVALEAKAAMTAHVKARPRLYDELNSSHLTVHGAADQALSVGLVMINTADSFISSVQNPMGTATNPLRVSADRQPGEAQKTLERIRQLPRRNRPGETGFDAVGVLMVECRNDGSPVRSITASPAPANGDDDHYDQMIRRVSSLYAHRFQSL